MNNDLKIIKKKYGEAMMHLCRELFATILDNHPGMLSQILLETFAPNRFLYDDLIKSNSVSVFKNYIYRIYEKVNDSLNVINQTVADPVTLMRQVGYTLYECLTEEDIQKFRKYYRTGEQLCTFDGGRLNRCYVYFAVHDNADKLRRDDFSITNRQDEYGTSVISIQFTRDDSHMLSIKNRYNHTVENPDATFSNNLDNIIFGLTQSFADYYGLKQRNIQDNHFEIFGYVQAKDGRFYPYNYEINNVYYCPENIVIDNFQVIKYEKEKYLVMDYFIVDLVNKKITSQVNDSFIESIGEIKKITIENINDGKLVIITPNNSEDVIIELDKYQNIISLKNNNVLHIADNFLIHNTELVNITLDNVISIKNCFLRHNQILMEISLPKVETIGDDFLLQSNVQNISLPNVLVIGNQFLRFNYGITSIELPQVKVIGEGFFGYNWSFKSILLPNLEVLGQYSLRNISFHAKLYAPKLKWNDVDKYLLIHKHDEYLANKIKSKV